MKKQKNFFTRRETSMLHLFAECYTYEEMCKELELSMCTIHTYVDRLMKKTNLHKHVYLVMYAREHGYGRREVAV